MFRQILSAATPALKVGGSLLSYSSNICTFASEWCLQSGFRTEWFSFLHHVIIFVALILQFLHLSLLELNMDLNSLFKIIFSVLSSVLFEVTRRSDPGVIPKRSEKSSNDENAGKFEFCDICNVYQPYRSHHCRRCNQCVERLDHHCVWMYCCIGAKNLRYFITMLFVSSIALYWINKAIIDSLYVSTSSILSVILVICLLIYMGLFLAVAALLVSQLSSAKINATTIELKGKINTKDYLNINPYFNAWDMGADNNFKECFNGYAEERHRWREPTQLSKLLTQLATKTNVCSSEGCNDHSHAAEQAKPAKTQQKKIVGDENA